MDRKHGAAASPKNVGEKMHAITTGISFCLSAFVRPLATVGAEGGWSDEFGM